MRNNKSRNLGFIIKLLSAIIIILIILLLIAARYLYFESTPKDAFSSFWLQLLDTFTTVAIFIIGFMLLDFKNIKTMRSVEDNINAILYRKLQTIIERFLEINTDYLSVATNIYQTRQKRLEYMEKFIQLDLTEYYSDIFDSIDELYTQPIEFKHTYQDVYNSFIVEIRAYLTYFEFFKDEFELFKYNHPKYSQRDVEITYNYCIQLTDKLFETLESDRWFGGKFGFVPEGYSSSEFFSLSEIERDKLEQLEYEKNKRNREELEKKVDEKLERFSKQPEIEDSIEDIIYYKIDYIIKKYNYLFEDTLDYVFNNSSSIEDVKENTKDFIDYDFDEFDAKINNLDEIFHSYFSYSKEGYYYKYLESLTKINNNFKAMKKKLSSENNPQTNPKLIKLYNETLQLLKETEDGVNTTKELYFN